MQFNRTALTRLAVATAVCAALSGCDSGDHSPAVESTQTFQKYGDPDAAFAAAIAVDTPTRNRPVQFGAVVAPATVSAGSPAVLVVRANLLANWHINEVGRQSEMLIPTRLTMQIPPGVEAVEQWNTPTAKQLPESDGPVYAGDFFFFHHLRVRPDAAPGTHTLTCTIEYQACDDLLCLPPASENLRIEIIVN